MGARGRALRGPSLWEMVSPVDKNGGQVEPAGALLGAPDVTGLALEPADFELSLAGASPDPRHVLLSTCAALTPDAIEVPLSDGCDPDEPNLYLWSQGTGISLVNVLPTQSQGEPGRATECSWQLGLRHRDRAEDVAHLPPPRRAKQLPLRRLSGTEGLALRAVSPGAHELRLRRWHRAGRDAAPQLRGEALTRHHTAKVDRCARIAQLVEHFHGKEGVTSSSLVPGFAP
jgi:hypothetical protein